jgi:hypothetical protein
MQKTLWFLCVQNFWICKRHKPRRMWRNRDSHNDGRKCKSGQLLKIETATHQESGERLIRVLQGTAMMHDSELSNGVNHRWALVCNSKYVRGLVRKLAC